MEVVALILGLINLVLFVALYLINKKRLDDFDEKLKKALPKNRR